jgi:hypothetical protein
MKNRNHIIHWQINLLIEVKHLGIILYSYTFLSLSVDAQINLKLSNDSIKIQKIRQMLDDAKQASTEPDGWLGALKGYGDAYRESKENYYLEGQAEALKGIADIEASFGTKSQEALPYYIKEIKIRQILDDKVGLINSYNALGHFFEDKIYEPYSAIGYFKQALYLQQKTNQPSKNQLNTIENIIKVHQYLNQMDSTIVYKKQEIKLLKADRNLLKVCSALIQLSEYYLEQNRLSEAMQYAQEAKKYWIGMDNESGEKLDTYIQSIEKAKLKDKPTEMNPIIFLLLAGISLVVIVAVLLFKNNSSKTKPT